MNCAHGLNGQRCQCGYRPDELRPERSRRLAAVVFPRSLAYYPADHTSLAAPLVTASITAHGEHQ